VGSRTARFDKDAVVSELGGGGSRETGARSTCFNGGGEEGSRVQRRKKELSKELAHHNRRGFKTKGESKRDAWRTGGAVVGTEVGRGGNLNQIVKEEASDDYREAPRSKLLNYRVLKSSSQKQYFGTLQSDK